MAARKEPAPPDPRRSPFRGLNQSDAAPAGYVDPDKVALRDQRQPLRSQQAQSPLSATTERQTGGTEEPGHSSPADRQTGSVEERKTSATSPPTASDGKIGYRISQEAIETIKDIETELRRKHRVKTKLR